MVINAINENRAVECWGNDAYGQVADSPAPQQEDGYLYAGLRLVMWSGVR